MNSESMYKAAISVSPLVENHFAEHLAQAALRGETNLAPLPPKKAIEIMIDAAFWASLRREEGHAPKISIAYVSPEQAGQALLLEQKIPFTPNILNKISVGVERPGVHLGVWHEGDQLYIWGTTLSIPNYCFVLDVSEPGLLVVKYRRTKGFGKFANVAVLIGDQIKIVDERSANEADCPPLLQSMLDHSNSSLGNDAMNVFVQLAVSMRAHKHGGNLLVVPANNDSWRESIIHPVKYSIRPAYSGLANLMRVNADERNDGQWQASLRREIDSIAGLTAVDGATLMSDRYELLAFGAKISRPDGKSRVEKVFFNEPIVAGEAVVKSPSQSGGTRHLSAAQFIHDQRDAFALVASQDGHFTLFSWSESQDMVQAHRIDTLLL